MVIAGFYEPRTQPYVHQSECLERSWDREFYGLLLEMGCGKTKILIDNVAMLHEAPDLVDSGSELECVLVVAPKGVYMNWVRREIPTHMPGRLLERTLMHAWRGGHSRQEQGALRAVTSRSHRTIRILAVNIEAIATSTKALAWVTQFLHSGRCMMIVDESSTIANPDAKCTERLIAMSRLARWRRIATGTPVRSTPLNLYSQFEFLSPSCLGYRSFYSFRNRYAVTESKEWGAPILDRAGIQIGRRPIKLVVAHRNIDELSERVACCAMVVRKEDALDLPPKVYITRDVELTPEQLRAYREMKEWATTELEAGKFVTATAVITQLLRLHQIVCGHTVTETGEHVEIPSRRLDALMEVVGEQPGKTIIWCGYQHDVESVLARLGREGRKAVHYYGKTTPEERETAIAEFQQGDAEFFVGTPHAGGYGITLTEARVVIYYSNSYDLEKRLQSEDRAHRIGQTRSVLYVDLIARGTVDEKIREVLERKLSLANLIMDGPARIREMMGTV